MLNPGDQVGQYVVEAVLGEGGMARVYRVRHRTLDSRHALKLLTVERPDITARLIQEGRIQAGLRHPHIVAVTDVIEHQGTAGLIMELEEGGTLEGLILRDGALGAERALALLLPVIDAVAFAHARGILHRDIKPANVLLGADGQRARIADFGVGKALQDPDPLPGRTRAGLPMGTPGYMAPEQWANAAGVDARADIFALGAVLYEAISGQRAFYADDMLDVLTATTAGRRAPLAEVAPGCPEWLVDVVDKALEPGLVRRYSDAGALLEALRAGLGASGAPLGTGLAPMSLTPPVPASVAPSDGEAAAPEAPPSVAAAAGPPAGVSPPSEAAPVAAALPPALSVAPPLPTPGGGETLVPGTLAAPAEASAPAPAVPAAPPKSPGRGRALAVLVASALIGLLGVGAVVALLPDDPPPEPAAKPTKVKPPEPDEAPDEAPAEVGACEPGGKGALGWWYAGRGGGYVKGRTISVPRPTNVRSDYPREDNGWSAQSPVVCVLKRGQRLRISGDPVRTGRSVWLPVRREDLVR